MRIRIVEISGAPREIRAVPGLAQVLRRTVRGGAAAGAQVRRRRRGAGLGLPARRRRAPIRRRRRLPM
ncbi:hypothetical protein L3i22_047490 [Actinoplanes sp. L3-i22]|nr:hypothetical protein L3i22_047490 [Actinoplanes sp. L3-i22]